MCNVYCVIVVVGSLNFFFFFNLCILYFQIENDFVSRKKSYIFLFIPSQLQETQWTMMMTTTGRLQRYWRWFYVVGMHALALAGFWLISCCLIIALGNFFLILEFITGIYIYFVSIRNNEVFSGDHPTNSRDLNFDLFVVI